MAHNCLADLLAVQLMLASSSFGIGNAAFITGDDLRLANFWLAVGASPTPPVNGKATGKFRISERLLPRIGDEGLAKLQQILQG